METIRRRGLIEQVTGQLREEIAAGRWPVGTRIPTEPELARLVGAGRNTVREAVQALVHGGLLERRQGSGTYVLADSPVTAALRREIDPARRRELLELRQALETTAAGLAALRRTDAEADAMHALLDEVQRHHEAGDLAAAARTDAALHRAVIAAAHNTTYLQVYEGVVPGMERDAHAEMADAGTPFPTEHRALIDAIADRDPARAEAAMHGFLAVLLRREFGAGPA